MLQTIQATPDAASQRLGKDQPATGENLPAGANTFYSHFMAALPNGGAPAGPGGGHGQPDPGGTQGQGQPQGPAAPRQPWEPRGGPREGGPRDGGPRPFRSGGEAVGSAEQAAPGVGGGRATRARAAALADRAANVARGRGADPAGPGSRDAYLARTGALTASDQQALDLQAGKATAALDAQAVQAAQDAQTAETDQTAETLQAAQDGQTTQDSQAAQDAAAAATAAGAAAAAAWLATPGLQAGDGADPTGTADEASALTQGPRTGTPPNGPGAQAAEAASSAAQAQAAAPETIAAAQAQAALAQSVPGAGKVQFQFGDPQTQTTKPALSEFMNQLKPQLQAPSFAGVGSASGDPPNPAAPAPGSHPDLQPLAPAAPASLVAGVQPPKENLPEAAHAPGHFAPLEALGAGAAPGATGAVRVAAPSAPEAAAPKYENSMAQVDSTIKWLIKNKEQSAELQLHPEHLGRVQIKLTIEGHEVHAKLWASEASALPVLQEHRAFLEASLKGQGLQLGSFDLQHGQQGGQTPLPRPEPSLPPPTQQATPAALGQETPPALARGAAGNGRISIVA